MKFNEYVILQNIIRHNSFKLSFRPGRSFSALLRLGESLRRTWGFRQPGVREGEAAPASPELARDHPGLHQLSSKLCAALRSSRYPQ